MSEPRSGDLLVREACDFKILCVGLKLLQRKKRQHHFHTVSSMEVPSSIQLV